MAVAPEVAAAVADQLKDWTPGTPKPADEAPAETKRAEAGWSAGRSLAEFVKEVGSAGALGAARAGDFVKGVAAGVAMPLIPEGNSSGSRLAWDLLKPTEDTALIQSVKERAQHPATFGGKVLNPAAEGVGGMAVLPMGGGLVRNVVAGMGMGEGSEIGKRMLGGLFDYFGGEKYRASGEATGAMLGGGAGAQLNVTRVRAMGEAAGQTKGAIEAIVPAYKSARAKQIAGDERGLFSIFADEFGSLRAQTRGIIENFTNANIAAAIKRDIRASSMAEEFVKDSNVTGMDLKPWGLGERVMVPSLTSLVRERRPASFAEASGMDVRAKSMQNAIVDAYNKLVGSPKLPVNEEGIKAAGQAFQAITQAKVDALAAEEGLVKNRFTKLDSTTEFQVGEAARGIRDRLANEAYGRATEKYAAAEAMFDAEGAQINVGNVRQEGKEILKDFYSRVDPTKVPPVVRSMLAETAVKEKAAGSLVLPEELQAEKDAAAAAKELAGKPLTLKESNDLVKAFSEAATNARQAENYTAFNRAKELQTQVLDSIAKAKVSPEAKQAYDAARENYRTDYALRFQEGTGKALGKERTGVFEGREAVKSEDVMSRFLLDKETGMQDFERIYGNNPQAKQLLQVAVEDKFRKEVLDSARTPDALERQLGAFKRKYAPALERMPQVADKVDQEAANVLKLQTEKKAELDRYKDLMASDVTKAVGPVQAKAMFQAALADPNKMRQLLAAMPKGQGDGAERLVKEVFQQAHPIKNGTYDPEALYQLVKAGKSNLQGPSSMEILFKSAFGEKEGQRHMDTLEAISNFTKREAATNPSHLRPESLLSASPVKEQTGQTMASWISAWRAQEIGATGSTYFTTLGLSRFANAKVQQAVEAAKVKALYDPATATAILEMAAKPTSEALSMTTARKIFKDIRLPNGQNLVDTLVDRGFVKAYVTSTLR